MALNLAYATQDWTTAVGENVEIMAEADSGFRDMFQTVTVGTKGYKFKVKRSGRRVSADIAVYEKGKYVRHDKSNHKFFFPGYYDERYPFSAIEGYDAIHGSETIPENVMDGLMQEAEYGVTDITESFKRAEELLCAGTMLTGVAAFDIGSDIVFPRKAESLVAYNAAHDFADDAINPEVIIESGCEFLVGEGKANANQVFTVIMGSTAWLEFKNHPIVQAQLDNRRSEFGNLDTIGTTPGMTPQGIYSAGSYNVRIMTYKGRYDDESGNEQLYMDPKKVIIVPEQTNFEFVYCGVKSWLGNPYRENAQMAIVQGERIYYTHNNVEAVSQEMGVRSAFMPILKNVDQVYTVQVIS